MSGGGAVPARFSLGITESAPTTLLSGRDGESRRFVFSDLMGVVMRRGSGKWRVRALHALLGAGLALGVCAGAMAAAATINSTPTSLQGSSDLMISLRHQDHMWQAANGEHYLVINRGLASAKGSLQLYSTPDQGLSWYPGPRLPGSASQTYSDGYLVGNTLYLTYTTAAGELIFTALQRKGSTAVPAWKTLFSETAFSSTTYYALNPGVAIDANGTIWIAFVARNGTNYSIRMVRKTTQDTSWVDTGFTFGVVDNLSIERSAKPVATATGMGMVYAVHNQILWASRENDWPLDQPWPGQVIFTSSAGDNDPYSSHFSVARDAQDNIHMSLSDGGRVGYSRYDAVSGNWSSKWISGDIKAAYIQTSIVGNAVVVTANNSSNRLLVYRSIDGGSTFTQPYTLVHPAPGNGVTYTYARMETVSNTPGPMLTLEQYVDNGTQRLLLFNVPLP